jgi:hypothetical protein
MTWYDPLPPLPVKNEVLEASYCGLQYHGRFVAVLASQHAGRRFDR